VKPSINDLNLMLLVVGVLFIKNNAVKTIHDVRVSRKFYLPCLQLDEE
jgi:hypothetical protein